MTTYLTYEIWRRTMLDNGYVSPWTKTEHKLIARTSDEAARKVRLKFGKCGFNNMSLLALPEGSEANQKEEKTS